MYCDECGAPLVIGQQRCGRCGKQIVGADVQRSRVEEHIRLLSVLWMALSAFNVIGGVVLVIVANTIFGTWHGVPGPGLNESTTFLRPLLSVIAGFILLKAAAGFLAGWGLSQREPWARMLALVLGFISLFNVPFGTALGIYTLWVLLPGHAEVEYERLGKAA